MISLYIIALNEEATIGRCIDSFRGAFDEVVVVLDHRTTDKTQEVAFQHGARPYHFNWIDDFSAMRNYAMDRCLGDWLMFADSDDVLDPESVTLVRDAVEYADKNGINTIVASYYTSYEGSRPTTDNAMPRLTRAGTMRWTGAIHEYQIADHTKEIVSNIEVHHRRPPEREGGRSQRNMGILEKVIPVCKPQELPRYTFYYARELMFAGRYEEAITWYDKYLPISTWQAEAHRALCDKAECQYLLGKKWDALETLQGAVTMNPAWPDPYVKIGVIYKELGIPTKCKEYMKEAQGRLQNTHPLFSSGHLLPKMITIYSEEVEA
jgi:glycosyltransferase involved in cell wall biosynthesis